jgi:tetratricopeptide (TPR) repeat protein
MQQDPGRLHEAAYVYEKVITLAPSSEIEAYNNAAVVYKKLGRAQEAESRFIGTLRMNPHHISAKYNYGNLLRILPGREQEALAQYDATIPLVSEGTGGGVVNYPILVELYNNKVHVNSYTLIHTLRTFTTPLFFNLLLVFVLVFVLVLVLVLASFRPPLCLASRRKKAAKVQLLHGH